MSETGKTERIRALNDTLRRNNVGGRLVITRGVAALAADCRTRILAAVRDFDAFNGDNDPYGEHDCASLQVDGHKVIWKIDYYDPEMIYGSEDPADPAKTTRVLTVMLAEEY